MPKGKATRLKPCVRHLRFHFEKGNGYYYLDLARELSAFNNSLYRQGMTYHVANVTLISDNDMRMKVHTIPNTWSMNQAWKVAFKNWLQHNRQIPEPTLSSALKHAKYLDFRVGFCKDQIDSDDGEKPGEGTEQDSMAVDGDNNTVKLDEWRLSSFHSTDENTSDEFYCYMMGAHDGAAGSRVGVSVIQAYHELLASVKFVDDSSRTDIETGVWVNLMDNESVNDDLVEELVNDYDSPPFDANSLLGMGTGVTISSTNPIPGSTVSRELHMDSDYQGMQVGGGFPVPLGLLCLDTTDMAGAGDHFEVLIELVPGDYKGLAAEPMGEPYLTAKKEWRVR